MFITPRRQLVGSFVKSACYTFQLLDPTEPRTHAAYQNPVMSLPLPCGTVGKIVHTGQCGRMLYAKHPLTRSPSFAQTDLQPPSIGLDSYTSMPHQAPLNRLHHLHLQLFDLVISSDLIGLEAIWRGLDLEWTWMDWIEEARYLDWIGLIALDAPGAPMVKP